MINRLSLRSTADSKNEKKNQIPATDFSICVTLPLLSNISSHNGLLRKLFLSFEQKKF